MIPQAVYILFGFAYTVAVAAALGKLLLRGLRLRFFREEEHVLAFLTGAPLLSTLVFLLCTAGLARKGVFLAVGAVILTVAWRRGAHRPQGDPLPPLDPFWRRLFLLLFAAFALLYWSNSMAPEISPDGTSYHLGLVARYLREHGFRRLTTNMYANLSQGVEMLFLFAFAFGRHSAAAMVHFAFLLALPLAMVCYGRRFQAAPAGACGALLVFLSPVVGVDGISAYIDVAVAALAFTLFYFLQVWDAERADGLWIPIGLVAGFGYAAKYTAVLGVPYALGFLLWKLRRKRALLLRAAATVAACAFLMMLPWLAKNWLWVHNPVSPFFNAYFPNRYVTPGFEGEYVAYLRNYGLKSRWQIPAQITIGGTLSGVFGPVFLLAPLALVALRWPMGRQLLLAALIFGIPYAQNIGTRFLIPAAPFIAIALAMVFLGLGRAGRYAGVALVVIHAVLSWPDVLALYTGPTTWRLVKVTWREALRIKPEEGFLRSNLPSYGIARLIERNVPPEGAVLTFSPVPEAYTSRNVLVGYQSASNRVLQDILWTPLTSDFAPTWLLRFRFPGQSLRRMRVVQTARGGPDYWSISEMRVYADGKEYPRAASWRLRAHPNPWYVQLAFDNSAVTRWSSQQTLFPGMFIEADFGASLPVDEVRLACAHDQYKVRLRLEGQTAAGQWKTLAAKPEESEAPPLSGMRRAAIEEVKARGVGYLVVSDADYYAADFRANFAQWGILEIAESNGYRLYRLL
ncbi:MAG TPA: glycosyltransferase family 39 protein [Bryobacteraceae bacterium]|nr:glycosyltransferase family 39 protein [Bryobacteraceae bacterium]